MKIKPIHLVIKKKNNDTYDAEIKEDVLSINCRSCSKVPDIRSPGCMRCMVHHISRFGNAERIRLRTSRDLELFGPAAETLCEIAAFQWSATLSVNNGRKSCTGCNNSRSRIMDILWSEFPEPNFDSARGRLMSFRPEDSRCNLCIQKTYRALDQVEHGINNLKKKISLETARVGDI